MKILKKMTLKVKALITLVLVGLVIGVEALRRYVRDGLSNGELQKEEELLQQEAAKRLADETAKLEAEKAEELAKIEAQKAEELKKAVEQEEKLKTELELLAKKDLKAFKEKAVKSLGIKEKKAKGKKTK
jgi:hypothetical protein